MIALPNNKILVLLPILVLVWAGCSSENESDSSLAEEHPIELTYWSSPNPQEYKLAQELVTEWNSANPGIQVKVQALPAGQSSEEVLLSAMRPTGDHEKTGDSQLGVDNVLFVCANYLLGDTLVLPYAGADSRIFGAQIDFNKLLSALTNN